MANNYAEGTFAPLIPKHLLTDEDYALFERFGVDDAPDGDAVYLYADDGMYDREGDEDSDLVMDALSKLIARSNGEVEYIMYEEAHRCDKMRQGEFGGGACFITATGFEWMGTSWWLQQQISKLAEVKGQQASLDIETNGGAIPC